MRANGWNFGFGWRKKRRFSCDPPFRHEFFQTRAREARAGIGSNLRQLFGNPLDVARLTERLNMLCADLENALQLRAANIPLRQNQIDDFRQVQIFGRADRRNRS